MLGFVFVQVSVSCMPYWDETLNSHDSPVNVTAGEEASQLGGKVIGCNPARSDWFVSESGEVIKRHIVGSLTIPRTLIKGV